MAHHKRRIIMGRKKRPILRKHVTNSVDIKLADELDLLSKRTRINKSRLLDEAIELLLIKHNKEGDNN